MDEQQRHLLNCLSWILIMATEFEEDLDMEFSDPDISGDELMSEDEEDMLNTLLAGENYSDDEFDDDYVPVNLELNNSQSSASDSQNSSTLNASQDPLAQPNMQWKDKDVQDDFTPQIPKFKPLREPGLQIGRFTRLMAEKMKNPLEFFKLFFTMEVISGICRATNEFAESLHMKGSRTSYFNGPGNTWIPVNEDEIYRFIGVLIFMSINKVPTLSRYWSTDKQLYNTIVPSIFTKNRFKAILSFLQITSSENMDKERKLTRVESLLNIVKETSKQLFQPYKYVSVDERMLPSKHRYSGIRQFVKDKPVRFGFKLWILACSITGYTYNFDVYLGKKNTIYTCNKYGLTYNVVYNLITDLLDQGYHLYIDNFFISKPLVLSLSKRLLPVVGTVKSTSTAMPACFKLDCKRWSKIASRGDYRWVREDGNLIVQWKDSTTVTLISSVHRANDTTVCERTLKKRVLWNKRVLVQPQVAHDYNMYMGGVDKSDQLLSYHSVYVKSMIHWWKVFFFHCIDIAVVNSYILYMEYAKKFNVSLPSTFGQLEFREALVKSLLDADVVKRKSSECLPIVQETRLRCRLCYAEAIMTECKPPNHRTHFYCKSCDVPLCLTSERNCFLKWHSEEGKKYQVWSKCNEKKSRISKS